MAARRDQEGLGADLTAGELDCVLILKRGTRQVYVHAGSLERPRIDPVQAIYLAPDIADQRRPVEPKSLGAPTAATSVGEDGCITAAKDKQLLRHAAADHTGAADA